MIVMMDMVTVGRVTQRNLIPIPGWLNSMVSITISLQLSQVLSNLIPEKGSCSLIRWGMFFYFVH